ncbi:SDR family NAD(P)-dependent oxidoreductase [Deinococcus puniceus]|uniref:SDR family NAD(P)-dependent oxidoreductase n=1 Tax=Deinococcus puniceus TaxID=1182568 RepID=UPI0009ED806F|nr:SDR family oxidoreductase [Deinococcus puniceus]
MTQQTQQTQANADQFQRHQPATALITGASGGIGEAIARQLAARGAHLILVARSEGKMQTLAQEMSAKHGIQAAVIALDLTRPDAGEVLEREVAARHLTVDILVNNAGFGGFSEFWTQDAGEINRMVAVNIAALTDLTRRFLPDMVTRGRGRVLNVASTAAFIPGPLMAVYYASKAYVLSFSEAVNEELRGTGVSVTALCPGPVETGFQDTANLGESKLLSGVARLSILSAEEVAKQGVNAMLRGQAVLIAGGFNRSQTLLPRLLPRAAVARLMARVQARRNV